MNNNSLVLIWVLIAIQSIIIGYLSFKINKKENELKNKIKNELFSKIIDTFISSINENDFCVQVAELISRESNGYFRITIENEEENDDEKINDEKMKDE